MSVLLALALWAPQGGPHLEFYSARHGTTTDGAGPAIHVDVRARAIPDGAQINFEIFRIQYAYRWRSDSFEEEPHCVSLPGRAWSTLDRAQLQFEIPIDSPGVYRLRAIFDPSMNLQFASQMRRDFRRTVGETVVRIGDVTRIIRDVERSWKTLEEQTADWNTRFSEIGEAGTDEDSVRRLLDRRADAIGTDVESSQAESRRSMLPSSHAVLALMTYEFNMMIHFMPPMFVRGADPEEIEMSPRFTLANQPFGPNQTAAWLDRLPTLAAREHALLEMALMRELAQEFLALADGRETVPARELEQRLAGALKEQAELIHLHEIVTLTEPRAGRYAAAVVYEDKKAKTRITGEQLLGDFSDVAGAAREAVVDNPTEKLAPFRDATTAFLDRLTKLEGALQVPPKPEGEEQEEPSEETPKEPDLTPLDP